MDENIFYPELTLETDDIIMELAIKKIILNQRFR